MSYCPVLVQLESGVFPFSLADVPASPNSLVPCFLLKSTAVHNAVRVLLESPYAQELAASQVEVVLFSLLPHILGRGGKTHLCLRCPPAYTP